MWSGGRGGEDEVARGRGLRHTGEWPGGVIVQGGRGVEAAELGRRSRTAAEQEARWETTAAQRRSGMPKCWRKAEEEGTYIGGPPFVPGEATTRDKRCFWAGRENSQPAAHL